MKKPTRGAWVPAYASLMRGKRRAIPRAVRFVFLEICLRVRESRGETIELRADIDLAEALMEDIGGPLAEVRAAVERLSAEGLIFIERWEDAVTIMVPSVATHGLGDDALRKALGRTQDITPTTKRTQTGQHPDTVSGRKRTQPGHCVRGSTDNNRTQPGPIVEEKREEERRVSRASAPETPTPEALPATSPEAAAVVAELEHARDLWPTLTPQAVGAVARRIADSVAREPTAARCGVTAAGATVEAVAQSRTYLASHPMATPEQVLAEVERVVVRYILGDCRNGKRRTAVVAPTVVDEDAAALAEVAARAAKIARDHERLGL